MRRTVGLAYATFALLATGACTGRTNEAPVAESAGFRDPSPHTMRTIAVDSGSLQVLDWGGNAPAVVLLHGTGGTPHNFDDLAPRLADAFHPLAYARRGHGRSTNAAAGFDIDRLTNDLKAVLDSSGIDRAILVGYSFAGAEVTRFAERFPERVLGVVYLDATYDYTDPAALSAFDSMPALPRPSPADLKSLDTYRQFYRSVFFPDVPWSPALEASMRDEIDVTPDSGIRARASGAMRSIGQVATTYHRDYGKVKAPALVVLAEWRVAAPAGTDSLTVARLKRWTETAYRPVQVAAANRAARTLRARVLTVPRAAHGSLPFIASDTLAFMIREFARGLGGR